MKKRITIFTTFRSASEAYSLNRVVVNQIKMFERHNYPVTVVVAKGFIQSIANDKDSWYHRVKLVEIPDVPVSNTLVKDKTFEEDIVALMKSFRPILEDTDVIITHDIVYQPAAIKHHVALRNMARWALKKAMDIVFLHWIHSAAKPADMKRIRGGGEQYMKAFKEVFPRSFYIAFNEYSMPRVASWFGVEESQVKFVPHPHDFLEYKQNLTKEIVDATKMLEKDVVCMYPCRLDRGKQPDMVLKTMIEVKNLQRSISCIIADFHSTGGDKVTYREQMKKLGKHFKLKEDELLFLSEFRDHTEAEVPHRVIQELFEFTNVFIMPSVSETYSLVVQEAMVKRNFVVLNQDFPPFRSIYGDAPYFRQYSSNIDAVTGLDGETKTQYTNERDYHTATAQYINYVLEHTRVLKSHNKIRQTRNLDYVFKHHIEPLLYADPSEFNY